MEKYTLGKPLIIKEKLQIPNSRFVKKYTLQNPSMVFDGNIFNTGCFTLSNKEYEKLPESIKKNIRELLSKTSNACSHNFFKRTLHHNNDKINYLDSDDFEKDYSQLWNSIELLNQ